jgi:eukaryotic-like serine/threonine-protein kinase
MTAALSTNRTISHYRIISKLGAGGMGEVYLAQDTKLDRKVALKVLPAELAANQDRMRRFTQEAKAAAALNHPNIATIHEIGEHDGTHYIVMELVDGVTLRHEIHQNQTELRKLLKYLQQVAEGLAKAHAAGIVHRDLKPDNIMVTGDGHPKILDFGLAKLIEPQQISGSGSSEVATAIMPQPSSSGAIMGTVGYMSPEQAKAKNVDQRSDIFSFGCVLYEAVTGRKPFVGDSVVDTLHKIIYDAPPLVTDSNPTASPELQRVIRRCLAKDPDERFQSIKEVAIELKELRRELEGVAVTGSPAVKGEMVSVSEIATLSGADKTGNPASSLSTRASSTQPVVAGVGHRKMITAAVAGLVLIAAIAALGFYLRSHSTNGAIQSIAVLPFQNRSADQDTDYLSDGLAESLIFRLSQLPGLKVSPTTSIMRYKGKDTDLSKIASELGVDSVMTGRFTKRGDNLDITVELVDTRKQQIALGRTV